MPFAASQLTAGLASMCMGLAGSPQYNQACNKASEAGAKQVGVYQIVDDGETKTMKYATNMGEDKLGHTVMGAGAAGVFLYRAYKDKSATLKLPNMGIADSITDQVTTKSCKLNLSWHF